MNRLLRVLVVSLACAGCAADLKKTVAVTAVGEPTGAAATAMIGANGGTLRSADGKLELIVPSGALAADTALTVTPITVTAPGGVQAWRLGPEGTTFSKPASVKVSFTDADVGGSSSSALRIAFQDSQRRWQAIKASTIDSSSITVSTTHLSDWSMLLGWQLRPPSANVMPKQTVALSVRFCNSVPLDTELELVSLVAECQDDEGLAPILGAWAVNGVTNGSSELGTVAPGSPTASYTAPNAAPSNPTVAVSVELNPPQVGKVLLVSNVTIGGGLPAAYAGTVTYRRKLGGPNTSTLPFDMNVSAQVSLRRSSGSTYDLEAGSATLVRIEKGTQISGCTCSASNVSGTIEANTGAMVLDQTSAKVTTFQWSASFTVPFTCTGSSDPSCVGSATPEFVAFGLVGADPACTLSQQVGYTNPNKFSGDRTVTCPVNPQQRGLLEESTWVLTGQ